MLRVATLVALVCAALSPIPAVAQQTDVDFCTSTPVQMLSVIEGQWTFKQGMGVGIGVVIPFPLPPHPPQSVRIDVDEAHGIATLRHAGQEMAILPIAADAVEAATRFETERLLDEADAEGLIDTSGGCRWVSLPLMLGSNTYALNAAKLDPGANVTVLRVLGPDSKTYNGEYFEFENFVFCDGIYAGRARGENVMDNPNLPNNHPGPLVTVKTERAVSEDQRRKCRETQVKAPKPGEMVMNLLVKFNGPNRGSGILVFAGEMDGYRFAARAPVTLTR